MAFENDAQLPPELPREDRYVLHNFYRLLNRAEKLRHRWYLARRRGDLRVAEMYADWLGLDLADPAVEAPGAEVEHLRRAAARLRQDLPGRVVIVHCPQCKAIARTPRARLCPDCGHKW